MGLIHVGSTRGSGAKLPYHNIALIAKFIYAKKIFSDQDLANCIYQSNA